MSEAEKIPYIDVDEMHEHLVAFYEAHAQPETLFSILAVMQAQTELLEEVEQKMFEHRDERFDVWREDLHGFSERIEWYSEAIEGADDPLDAYDVIAPPLFEGVYPKDVETPPDGPDNQTIWKLANQLVVIGDDRDLSADALEEMQEHYRTFVEVFWNSIAEEISMRITADSPDDVVEEGEAAIEDARKNALEQPEEVVGLRSRAAGEGRSIAPLLLAAGAIWLMSKRKGR